MAIVADRCHDLACFDAAGVEAIQPDFTGGSGAQLRHVAASDAGDV